MRFLLDTHVLIWTIAESYKLSDTVSEILQDSQNQIFVSSLSLWEISLKYSLRKFSLEGFSPEELPDLINRLEFEILPLNAFDASTFHKLSGDWHKDPFDRMLIWQAIKGELILVTKDDHIAKYQGNGLKTIW